MGVFLVGKGNSFTLSRQFIQHADGLEVHHSLLTLAKRVQGKGLTKKLFKELYSRYQRIGARYLTVDANIDIGGYAWAKYGFQANNMQEILDAISMGNGSSDTKVKAQNFVRNYYQKNKLQASEPFPTKLLAEQPWGKEALMGSYWSGTIDLENEVQKSVFEHYLGLR